MLLGRSLAGVMARRRKLGFGPRQWSEGAQLELRTLLGAGHGPFEIALIMRRTFDDVRRQIESPVEAPPPKAGSAWTPDDDVCLVQLREEGTTAREIATLLERTVEAVQSRTKKLGATRTATRFTAEEDSRIASLASRGLSNREIGDRVGRAAGVVGRRLRTLSGRQR